jgi:hypothetical protein
VAADPLSGLLYIAKPGRTVISLDPATGEQEHVTDMGAGGLAVTADGSGNTDRPESAVARWFPHSQSATGATELPECSNRPSGW